MVSSLSLAQLARLRVAWYESVKAMSKIKEFYIKQDPKIASAFEWRIKNIPPIKKPYSGANLIAVEVALFGVLSSSAAVYFLLYALDNNITVVDVILIAVSSIFTYIMQWRWYRLLLD